ncbi:AMP-binding protein [Siphonobacter sp. SORGH_AS_1065]|uniref:AMP-binding protein n=1 Tax=Siphonobacter sp. SORGH_AS_1065 TaxID=3041795 RepID=UPI002783121A|nr:AMP-binding protein [Siphonobacter sp. SORGH_AS_1065]MDQ1088891.1 O-succinylbenzoic acid--CoA ligase [Siphonobacter sp. SORGH_AS_1065]
MIVIHRDQPLPVPHTSYEEKVIGFCEQWLAGQSTFTIHTSGSTGIPKAIELTRSQMQASAQLTADTFQLQKGDRALCCLNVEYIAGMMMLVRALEIGLELEVIEPTSALSPYLNGIDFVALVPLQLQKLLENPEQHLPALQKMKAIILGGAAVSSSLQEKLNALSSPVYATYGMTETVSHIAVQRLNGPEKTDYFQALPGVELGLDERGCLHITAAASNHERIQTNDVAEMLGESRFRILGRADNIINSGGVKIQLEEVDRLLEPIMHEHFTGKRYFTWGFPNETLGQQLALVIEGETQVSDQINSFLEHLKSVLPTYKNPRSIHFISQFMHTPSNKIDKKTSVAQLNRSV